MHTSKQKWSSYLFLSPYIVLYAAFGLMPILYSFYLSLMRWNGIGAKAFVGLDNYLFLFNSDSHFFKSIYNTLLLIVFSLPLQLAFGLVLAVLLYSRWVKWRAFFQLANFLPFIVAPVAIGLMFNILFDWQAGFINKVLIAVGWRDEGIDWLGEPWSARLVIIVMMCWKGFGYTMVFYLAALANISKDLYEAAEVDGASPLRMFWQITLPLLKPVTTFLVITGIIGGFQLMEEPMLLVKGFSMGVSVVGGADRCCLTTVWNMYDTAFGSNQRYGLGAAMAYGLTIIIAFVSFLGVKFLNRGDAN